MNKGSFITFEEFLGGTEGIDWQWLFQIIAKNASKIYILMAHQVKRG